MRYTKRYIALLLIACLTFILMGCSSSIDDDATAATVDGQEISVYEFKIILKGVKNQMESEAALQSEEEIKNFWDAEIDGKNATDVAKEKALDEAVKKAVQLNKAKEMGIEFGEEEQKQLDQTKEEYINSVGGSEQYKKQLESIGLTDEMITQLLKDDILTQQVYQKTLEEENNFNLTEEDAKKYYDENPDLFTLEQEQVKAKHILFKKVDDELKPLPEEDVAKAKSMAENILSRIKEGEDFDELMKQYSEDEGLASFPDGYTFGPGQMVPAFEETAYALKKGEVSNIVESEFGFHIIKLVDKFKIVPFESIKDSVLNKLITDKYLEQVKQWTENADVEANEDIIKKIELEETKQQ